MIFGAVAALAQPPQQQPPKPAPQQQQPEEQEPPEEDASLKPREYTFNPLQAQKDLRVGVYYFHKGNFKAAAGRFKEASKWDPNLAEAWLRLGEAQEKLHDKKAAKDAYKKFVEMDPDSKDAAAAKKKISSL